MDLKEGAEKCTEEIFVQCREALGPVMTPKQIAYANLSKSAVGKVLKRTLRDDMAKGRSTDSSVS